MKKYKLLKSALLTSALFLAPLSAAKADQATAKIVASHAYAGTLQQGISELQKQVAADPKNGEAVFGLGTLQFFKAIEGLQQDLYRYGAGNSQTGQGARSFLPVLRVPVAPNPNAEVASYEIIRGIFQQFVDRMKQADKTLAQMAEQPFKVPLDLAKIRYDMDGDGKATEQERFLPLLSILTGMRGRGFSGVKTFEITYDTADAYWLRGYSNALMSIGNFFLSFDFENSYDASFHVVFGAKATSFGRQFDNVKGDPAEIATLEKQIADLEKEKKTILSKEQSDRRTKLTKEQFKIRQNKALSKSEKEIQLGKNKDELKELRALHSKSNELNREIYRLKNRVAALDPEKPNGRGMAGWFNPINFLHSINWKVIEPDRLKAVRQNLLTVMRLNQTTWRLASAETDDDHEWLPNPKQTSPFPDLKVTQETIDSWLKVTSSAEQVLEGKLLTPHLRFGRGVNMKRFFEEATHFDLILFLTGPNSIQYVEKGPVWDQTLMRALRGPMGRNFNAYALWFN